MPWTSGADTNNTPGPVVFVVGCMAFVGALALLMFGLRQEVQDSKAKQGCDYYADRVISQVPAGCVRHFMETSK